MHQMPIIVFSHLRWDFVFQRPQHLLSRLAQHRPIFFIEEPFHADQPRWEKSSPAHNVTVCRPHTTAHSHGFTDEQINLMLPMVRDLLAQEKISDYVIWCYTAMSYRFAAELQPRAVAFDVMDELSAFKGAPPEMLENEKRLLARADVVFTGGPSLYRAKKDRHKNVHCFSSSVDAAHFAAAKENSPLEEAADQKNLPHPRLGFYGVIDERMDLDLLSAMAAAHPDWQIIMVGPVVKIDPAHLPRPGNIHYMGQRSYGDLPTFLRGWDVCLLPFARNDSTKFISPTKTLEYMAAERQIVSTPITDVAEPYGDTVLLGDTPAEFIAACEHALAMPPEEQSARINRMRQVLARTSWNATATAINDLINEAIEKKSPFSGAATRSPNTAPPALADSTLHTQTAIIGAGPTGLSAAYHLGGTAKDNLLIEQNPTVGGWCRSIEDRGFTFDHAGHIMFSNDPYVHELYKMLLGDNLHWQNREAWIYSKNVYTRYPFQGALYGLPPKVVSECIVGAIEARFGSLKSKADDHARKLNNGQGGSLTNTARMNTSQPAASAPPGPPGNHNGNGHAHANGTSTNGASTNGSPAPHGSNGHSNGHATNGNAHSNGHRFESPCNGNGNSLASRKITEGDVKDCCADGIAESTLHKPAAQAQQSPSPAPRPAPSDAPPNSFEDFIYKVWGAGIAKHFAIPYNRKIWAVDLKEMETSWLGGRVPLPDLEEMIRGALEPVPPPMGPNARFGYPLKGGFQALMNGFLPHIQDRLLLNTRIVAVSPGKKTLTLSTGQTVKFEQLISTMPLPVLIRMIGNEAPAEVQQAAANLRHTSVKCVNIGVAPRPNSERISEKHWIYYPEDTVFHRIFVQGNASPFCNPDGGKGGFGFTCEITYGPQKPLPCDGQDLINLCIKDAQRVNFIKDSDVVLCANVVDMPFAYVVYDHARPKNIAIIKAWLAQHDIILVGRYSEWEYFNSDHAFLAGKRGAEEALQLRQKSAKAAALAATAVASPTPSAASFDRPARNKNPRWTRPPEETPRPIQQNR